MEREWNWSEFLFLSIGAFLAWIIWTLVSGAGGYACSSEIRQALDESARIVAAGLARPASLTEQEQSIRKRLVPDVCSPEQFRESFEREQKKRHNRK